MKPTPPLLLIVEGRRPRPRKAPTVRPKEIVLHMCVAKLLRTHCHGDWQWCHVPNGELRDKRTAGKLKQMSAKAGWPDFILTPPAGRLHCLELKRVGEDLSNAQDEFRMRCTRHGVPHVTALFDGGCIAGFPRVALSERWRRVSLGRRKWPVRR